MIVSLSLTSSPGRDKALAIIAGAFKRGAYATNIVQSNPWSYASRFISTVINKPVGYKIVILAKSSAPFHAVVLKGDEIICDSLSRFFSERDNKGFYKYDKDGDKMLMRPMFTIGLDKALEIYNAKADKAKQ